jgi:hypothetical protein
MGRRRRKAFHGTDTVRALNPPNLRTAPGMPCPCAPASDACECTFLPMRTAGVIALADAGRNGTAWARMALGIVLKSAVYTARMAERSAT